jgi:paraquat-inducible protein B
LSTETQTRNPWTALEHTQQRVKSVLHALNVTTRRGNTTTLVRGIRAQENDMALVVGSHELGESFLKSENYRVPTVCVEHLQYALQGTQRGLVFDNSAVTSILSEVDRSITDALAAAAPRSVDSVGAELDALKQQLGETQRTLETAQRGNVRLKNALVSANAIIKSMMMAGDQVFGAQKDEIEKQAHTIHLLDEQVQVLTRALGDSQDRIAELTARN